MTLAPSWLPRQQRRHVERALRKLLQRGVCSVCGGALKHNSPTASGFDAHGTVAVAGECCFDRLTQVFGMGLYSDRQYDFLSPSGSTPGAELAPERIAEAVAAYTKAISDTDQLLADVARRAGGVCVSNIVTQNHPWKSDDKLWFEQHPERAHRTRSPFPGEIDEAAIKTSAERALVMLIRQVEPGARLRAVVDIIIDLLPLPDDEATLHALFEAGMGREAVPRDREALRALAEKYTAPRESSQ